MDAERLVRYTWYGSGPAARLARALLTPPELVFRAASGLRGFLYDRGIVGTIGAGVPVVAVGNLTVGGTGKTPIAAAIATMLADLGRRPAVLLRGYGRDEVEVHRELNPGIPVHSGADRSQIARRIVAEGGAGSLVLDDGFQHRRLERDLDIVLLSADRPIRPRHRLPAGPWREGLAALSRADLVLVTRKAASDAQVQEVLATVREEAPATPTGVAGLLPSRLESFDSASRPLSDLAGLTIVAVAALGHPEAFRVQLELLGADVRECFFGDHHEYTAADVESIQNMAIGADLAVCTLKDAVKLRGKWPRNALPLCYISQVVEFQEGGGHLAQLLNDLPTQT